MSSSTQRARSLPALSKAWHQSPNLNRNSQVRFGMCETCTQPPNVPQMSEPLNPDLNTGLSLQKSNSSQKMSSLFARRFILNYCVKQRQNVRLLHVPTSIREPRNPNTYLSLYLLWRLAVSVLCLTCLSQLLQT